MGANLRLWGLSTRRVRVPIAHSRTQDDPELDAIRQRRMAELMARQGGAMPGGMQASLLDAHARFRRHAVALCRLRSPACDRLLPAAIAITTRARGPLRRAEP